MLGRSETSDSGRLETCSFDLNMVVVKDRIGALTRVPFLSAARIERVADCLRAIIARDVVLACRSWKPEAAPLNGRRHLDREALGGKTPVGSNYSLGSSWSFLHEVMAS